MALRLRYGDDKSIVLSSGQIFIGRATECHVQVRDVLASRRHAAITMSKAGAFVSDLGSRAGVIVNGEPIQGAKRLARGDTIEIVNLRLHVEELTIEPDDDEPTDPRMRSTLQPPASASASLTGKFRVAPTPAFGIPRTHRAPLDTLSELEGTESLMRTQEAPRVDVPAGLFGRDSRISMPEPRAATPKEPPPSREASSSREITALSTRDVPPSREAPSSREVPGSAPRAGSESSLGAVAVLAEKAWVRGRNEEAERILQRALTDVFEAARRGDVDPATLELAASLAARLATATAAGRWVDGVIAAYRAREEVPPAGVIDLLYAALHKVKSVDKLAFREYVSAMKLSPTDSPARRFLLQRLEGLGRLAALK